MKTNNNNEVNEAVLLRLLAEDKLKNETSSLYVIDEINNLKLIHELQVHQIELEMQNEELQVAKENISEALEKYTELYDFAPSGYISLSREGDIESLNLSAAKLLGKDRNELNNSRFGLFIHPDYKIIYNQTIFQALTKKRNVELYLLTNGIIPVYVHIDVVFSDITNQYLLTITDITARKQLEVELENSLHHYKTLNGFFVDRELKMIELKKEINDLLIKSGCEKRY